MKIPLWIYEIRIYQTDSCNRIENMEYYNDNYFFYYRMSVFSEIKIYVHLLFIID